MPQRSIRGVLTNANRPIRVERSVHERGEPMRGRFAAVAAVLAAAIVLPGVARAGVTYSFGAPQPTDLTTKCSGQNAEVEQATDPVAGYVYEEWMGCSGIAFARS